MAQRRRLYERIDRLKIRLRRTSTERLANILLGMQIVCVILLVSLAYIETEVLQRQTIVGGVLGLILMELWFFFVFLLGLLFFQRKRNPYSLVEQFFSSTRFSLGLAPRLTGLFIMFVSIGGMILIPYSLIIPRIAAMLEGN